MRALPALLSIAASSCVFAANQDDSDTKRYVKHTFGPVAWVRGAAAAGLDHIRNSPPEWGQGAVGFGRRFASAFGYHIVKKSIEFPVAKLTHEHYGYQPSDKVGFKPRLMYAVTSIVITHKTTDGSKTMNASELSGGFGAGLISRLWAPASASSMGAGFTSAGITFAIDAGYNVVREFWPEIRHPRSHAAVHASIWRKDESQEIEIAEQDREED